MCDIFIHVCVCVYLFTCPCTHACIGTYKYMMYMHMYGYYQLMCCFSYYGQKN